MGLELLQGHLHGHIRICINTQAGRTQKVAMECRVVLPLQAASRGCTVSDLSLEELEDLDWSLLTAGKGLQGYIY